MLAKDKTGSDRFARSRRDGVSGVDVEAKVVGDIRCDHATCKPANVVHCVRHASEVVDVSQRGHGIMRTSRVRTAAPPVPK